MRTRENGQTAVRKSLTEIQTNQVIVVQLKVTQGLRRNRESHTKVLSRTAVNVGDIISVMLVKKPFVIDARKVDTWPRSAGNRKRLD